MTICHGAEHQLKESTQKEAKEFIRFSKTAKEALKNYAWPGNVRELQNVIQNAVVLNNGTEIEPDMLSLRTLTDAAPK